MCASKAAAGAIALAVEGVEEPAVVLVRDDGVHASSEQVFADLVAVIGLVGQEFVCWRRGVEYDRQHPGAGGMSGRERGDKKTPFPIAQGMVLSRSTTARATNRLACPPFSASAAERCALMWVEPPLSCHRPELAPCLE